MAVVSGVKKYEVRIHDRAFQVGDMIRLREWSPTHRNYSGEECFVRITHMTDSSTWHMIPNHLVIFGIELVIK